MKKQLLLLSMLFVAVLLVGFTSCSKDDDDEKENTEYKALFFTTDNFVSKLGYSNSFTDSKTTSDGKYLVSVLGRMIIVKKKSSVGESYSKVRDALYSHYKSNSRVNDVFINNGGTITIDCRK